MLLIHQIHAADLGSVVINIAQISTKVYANAVAAVKLRQLRDQINMTAALAALCAWKLISYFHGFGSHPERVQ